MRWESSRRGRGKIVLLLLTYLARHQGCLKTELAMAASLNGLQAGRYLGYLEAARLIARVDSRYYVSDLGREALFHLRSYMACVHGERAAVDAEGADSPWPGMFALAGEGTTRSRRFWRTAQDVTVGVGPSVATQGGIL